MLAKINGKPVKQLHKSSAIITGQSVTLKCSCGWWCRRSKEDGDAMLRALRAFRTHESQSK